MKTVFEKMGADLKVMQPNSRVRNGLFGVTSRTTQDPFTGLNVTVVRGVFLVQKPERVNLQVVSQDVRDRHLLLMAKAGKVNQKFLCGHDERDWFVAAVPATATNVQQAKDSLRPLEASVALDQHKVRRNKRHNRHNPAYIRQEIGRA